MLQDPFDPEEVRQHLPQPVDLIVVDHYGLDARYESHLRDRAHQILVIDDLVDRPHDCDILLDQTFGRDAIAYKPLVPPGAKILAGATYALLRPEFAAAREKSLDRRRNLVSVDRILISMGLTDLGGITAQVLHAVLDVCPGKAIDVVLGPSATSLPAVQATAAAHPNVTVHIDPPSMPDLMAAADLAIGAAGTTTWERCCLGLPTITMVLASNQVEIAQRLSLAQATIIASCKELRGELNLLTKTPEAISALSTRAAAVTDGNGANLLVATVQGGLV
jgi:UDP-2,4-diacetamido-2,4,6-trideoxy-beta-L-altropyranose hydrolase